MSHKFEKSLLMAKLIDKQRYADIWFSMEKVSFVTIRWGHQMAHVCKTTIKYSKIH